jgi:hypothetical protein
MSDPLLGKTYEIEEDLDTLKQFRSQLATQLHHVALELAHFSRKRDLPKRQLDKQLDELWKQLYRQRDQYSAICVVCDATEKHCHESHLLDEVFSMARDMIDEKRQKYRDDINENYGTYLPKADESKLLYAMLVEIRALRDRLDPPEPRGPDIRNARRIMNSART